MPLRHLSLILLLLATVLTGCSREPPEDGLQRAVSQLQENLEAKQNNAVLEQLHPQFIAQQQFDRDWARRTMALMFLRHRNVQVIALGTRNRLDPGSRTRGYTNSEVTLAGAEGLIPDSARQYSASLEWWLEDGEWKLARLDWK